MSLIHREHVRGKTYEIRQAGASIRLYTNGAFHSQWNPNHIFSGAVWDLLSLPCLFAQTPPRNSLMLGVGGGAGINQLRFLFPHVQLTGVEIDRVHLNLAQRFFKAGGPHTTFVLDDALEFIRQRPHPYDVVIDDLYLDAPSDPEHPAEHHSDWTPTLIKRTSPKLVLIKNHLDLAQRQSWLASCRKTLKAHFKSGLSFHCEGYSNVITALYTHPLETSPSLSDRLQALLNRYPLSAQAKRNLRRVHLQSLTL